MIAASRKTGDQALKANSRVAAEGSLSDASKVSTAKLPRTRRMVSTELMGSHSHETNVGTKVHIFQRDGKYLARGRFEGRQFGVNLGSATADAKSKLRHLMNELEDGTFLPPSESRKRPLKSRRIPKYDLRGLINEFLAEKRKLKGKKTSQSYSDRLAPILDFAEQNVNLKRWPLASDIDREFVTELRQFLINRQVTRNGRSGAARRPMSVRQVINCLETLRMVVAWASRADVRRLPPEFVNPVANDIIGKPQPKDPLRKSMFPLDRRIELLMAMDEWQFRHLTIALVIPVRHEDISGALISDVDFNERTLSLGTRFNGSDYNKGHVDVLMPLPAELIPLLRDCAGGRSEGPLFRQPSIYAGKRKSRFTVNSSEELESLFHRELARARPGEIQTEQDRKRFFRQLLAKLGGVSEKYVGKKLREVIGPDQGVRAYDLRGSITSEMKESGINHLELRYFTQHTVNDILNEYTGLNPQVEMEKYFQRIIPLLDAIQDRSKSLGIETKPTAQRT